MKFQTTLISRVALICSLTFFLTPMIAQSAEREASYDEIVSELSSKKIPSVSDFDSDPLSAVQIHLGVGLDNSFFAIEHANGLEGSTTTQANQRGILVSLGIDLFSPFWVAEGSVMSTFDRDYDHAQVGLNEFDLKIYYKNNLDSALGFKIGGGLGARALTLKHMVSQTIVHDPKDSSKNETVAVPQKDQYSTPCSIMAAGLEYYLTKKISLGTEISYRNTLISETPDQSSIDLTLKLDSHF